jgi:AcrR family transcriptional regulator
MEAAYDLFSVHGVFQVGIDTILAKSGCAKASLYNNFDSKEALAIEFLEQREARWTHGWFEGEVRRRARTPRARLLAIFDVLDAWFQRKDFEGCAFIKVLLESTPGSPVRRASALCLANIRSMVREWAREAGLAESEKFAQVWHMMMKGSIVTAGEGNREAARQAKDAARLLLDNWKRAAAARR